MLKDCPDKWTAKTSCLNRFRFLQFSLNSKIIKSSNAPLVIGKVAENSHVGRQIAWDFILKHWNILEKRLSILWPLVLFSVCSSDRIFLLCLVHNMESLHLKYITTNLIYQLSRWSKLVTVKRFVKFETNLKLSATQWLNHSRDQFWTSDFNASRHSSFFAIAFHLQGG